MAKDGRYPGEVRLVDLFDRRGHEQQGRRPCVIVGEANGLVVAIPLTNNVRRLAFNYTLLVEPDRRNRLSAPSVAMAYDRDRITTPSELIRERPLYLRLRQESPPRERERG
ncbi:MAG: type II toxin-antitoxin system PemK/MazF family toxin [Methanoregulaceae archaeon]